MTEKKPALRALMAAAALFACAITCYPARGSEYECMILSGEGQSAMANADFKGAVEKFNAALECNLKYSDGKETEDSARDRLRIAGAYRESGVYYQTKLIVYNVLLYAVNNIESDTRAIRMDGEYELFLSDIGSGDYEDALETARFGLNLCLKYYGYENFCTVKFYTAICEASVLAGEWDCAMENCKIALEMSRKVNGERHHATAQAYQKHGDELMYLPDKQFALENYRKAEEIAVGILVPGDVGFATYYNSVGEAYLGAENYENAMENFRKALNLTTSQYPNGHPESARDYSNVAKTFAAMGDNKSALEYYMNALGILEKCCGDYSYLTARAYNNVGLMQYRLMDYNGSIETYKKTIKMLGKSEGTSAGYITVDSYLGIALDRLGQNDFPTALVSVKKAEDILLKSKRRVALLPKLQSTYKLAVSTCEKIPDKKCAEEYKVKLQLVTDILFGKKKDTATGTSTEK